MLVEAARQAERWIAGIENDLACAVAPASAAASGD
jgi:hypothetical protein